MRVPVPDGSLTDITCVLEKIPSAEEINAAFKNKYCVCFNAIGISGMQ